MTLQLAVGLVPVCCLACRQWGTEGAAWDVQAQRAMEARCRAHGWGYQHDENERCDPARHAAWSDSQNRMKTTDCAEGRASDDLVHIVLDTDSCQIWSSAPYMVLHRNDCTTNVAQNTMLLATWSADYSRVPDMLNADASHSTDGSYAKSTVPMPGTYTAGGLHNRELSQSLGTCLYSDYSRLKASRKPRLGIDNQRHSVLTAMILCMLFGTNLIPKVVHHG